MFWRYVSLKIKTIAALFLFAAIFVVTFLLCRLPMAAVLYPICLCVLIGGILLAADYYKQKRKYSEITALGKTEVIDADWLPPAETLAECAYAELIPVLKSESAKTELVHQKRTRDMTEYYTAWAHQIKTPISAMKLALQSEDSPQSRRLKSDLFRIEQYVEMVLTFLRLDSDSTDYVFRTHRVDDIVRGAVKKFASEFIGRKIRLVYEPIDGEVVTDEKWLSFVIEQVLSNALKYTREGSIGIFMTAPKTLCIRDTGIGISPADLPRIFEKGFTGFNGRTDRAASGIGLYLCKRVCHNLGIEISAESEPNVGTTILLDLRQHTMTGE